LFFFALLADTRTSLVFIGLASLPGAGSESMFDLGGDSPLVILLF
jgi:hypothetical protein